MTNREAFEKWYKEVYWDFSKVERPKVSFSEEKQSYNHLDVDLAWNAWCAALVAAKTVDILDYNSSY